MKQAENIQEREGWSTECLTVATWQGDDSIKSETQQCNLVYFKAQETVFN